MFFGRLTVSGLGRLRTRAQLLAPVETADEIGGVARSFSPVASLWCKIEPILGDERYQAGRVEEVVSYRIEMRWRSDVAAAMRLSIGTRLFEIIASADPNEKRRRLFVLAEEIKT